MGSIGSAIAGVAKGVAHDPELGEVATKAFSSLEGVAARSEPGQSLMHIWKNFYEPTFGKVRQGLVDVESKKPLHLQKTAGELTNEARNAASDFAFKKNQAVLAHIYNWSNITMGPEYTQLLADHVAVNLQDTENRTLLTPNDPQNIAAGGPKLIKTTTSVSRSKLNAVKTLQGDIELDPKAVFQPRTKWESRAQNWTSTVLVPFIAISHLSTLGTNMLFAPTKDLGIALGRMMDYQGAKSVLLNTGIYNELAINTFRELQQFNSGIYKGISDKTGMPKLGFILGKMIHSPGFNPLRDVTITFAGTVGKLSIDDWAAALLKGDKYAELQLKQLGLDPVKIAAQGGKLTADEMERSIYRYVDDHVFLQSKTGRSFYSQNTQWGRMGTMFHQYVSRQAQLLRREFTMSVKSKDPMQYIKLIAVMGVAWPAIGSVVEGLEDFGRTFSLSYAWNKSKDRYAQLTNTDHPLGEMEAYLDFMAHIGGLSIMSSYTRALGRNAVGDQFLGPLGNVGAVTAQDAFHYLKGVAEGRKVSAAPLGRDVLEYSMPDNLGKVMAHRLLPTKAEQAERSGVHKIHRLKGLKGLKKLKGL